jgi:hypothetical protein
MTFDVADMAISQGMTADRIKVKRWIRQPDLMQDDPIIQKLRESYSMVMPNVGLSENEVGNVIAYLGTLKGATGEKSKSPRKTHPHRGHGMGMHGGMMNGMEHGD